MKTDPTIPSHWQRTTSRRVLVWLCRWAVVRTCCLALAVLVTIPALFYAVENWRGTRAWERHRRALAAQGERLTLVELAPAPVPDAQNLAQAPLLQPMFQFTRRPGRPLEWLNTNGLKRLDGINPSKRTRTTTGDPEVGELDLGTFADLEACARFYRGNTNYPQASAASSAAEVVRVALGAFDGDLAELRAEAASRPACRFPIDYGATEGAENVFAILLPHLAKLKGISHTLALRATASLELKQSAAAMADWELAWRLSNCMRDEPLLIDHLVRLATVRANLQVIREGLVRHAWSDEQLATLQRHLASVDLLAEYRLAIQGERACVVEGIDWARRQGWRYDVADLIAFQGDVPEPPRNWWLRFMPSGWYFRNMILLSELHQNHTLAAVNPQNRRVSPETCEAGRKAVDTLPSSARTVLARQLFPGVLRATPKTARMQTWMDAARVACALERSRLATGQQPDSIEPLVPRFLDSVPNDVIDGQPLRYRRLADGGTVVYSIGWNGRDDGGERGTRSSVKGAAELSAGGEAEAGDWVWSLPR